jgi:hypothetical protein
MENLDDRITLIRKEINLTQDPQKRLKLNKQLNVFLFRKEIETIKKKIEQLTNS